MKISRLERILRLLTVLQSGRNYRPTELAAELNVSRRTIFRDLEMLYKAGIPCYYNDEKGGYAIDDGIFLPPLNLKLSEALSLLLVARLAGGDEGLPLQRQAGQAAFKIESVLPSHIRRHCGMVLNSMSARFAARAQHSGLDGVMTLLQQAIQQQRKVSLVYGSLWDKQQVETTLSPYHLHFAQRAWYVMGESSLHGAVRTFKLSRIAEIKMLEQGYVLEKPFRLDAYLGDAWQMIPEGQMHEVKLRFAGRVAKNVAEVVWHHKQRLTWHGDGSLTFEVRVDGLREISWWVLGYGDQVEVVAPEGLRQMIADAAENMVSIYRKETIATGGIHARGSATGDAGGGAGGRSDKRTDTAGAAGVSGGGPG